MSPDPGGAATSGTPPLAAPPAAPSPLGTWRALAAWLGPYLRPHRGAFALTAVAAVAGTFLGLVPPLVARHLIDDVLVARDLAPLGPLLAVGVGVSLAAAGLGALAGWVHTRATARVLAAVREDLLTRLLWLPPATRHAQRPGDLVARLVNDVAEAQRALVDVGLGAFTAAVTAIGALGWLLWLDGRLALVCLAAAPVLAVATARLRPWTLASARELRALGGDGMASLHDALAGATHVQAHDLQDAMVARYAAHNERFLDAVLRERLRAGVARAVPAVVLGTVAAVVLGWGATRVVEGALTAGALVAFTAYVWRFFGPLRGLAGLGLRVLGAPAAPARVAARRALAPVVERGGEPPPPGPWALRLAGVGFAYDPDRPVLRDVTCEVPAVVATALVGPSGAGKSTLLLVLLGLVPGHAGTVQVNGIDLATLDGRAWRRRLAWVSPDAPPLHASVAENLALGSPEASEAAMWDALGVVGLDAVVRSWPDGLATRVGERGLRLSGGQRQRLALAAALLRDPELLILDEATGALDPASEEAVWAAIAARRQGRTTLLVTHRQAMAGRADHVLVLAEGRIESARSRGAAAPAEAGALVEAPGGTPVEEPA